MKGDQFRSFEGRGDDYTLPDGKEQALNDNKDVSGGKHYGMA